MNIIGKEYRCITPVDGMLDHSYGYYKIKKYVYIYIYDDMIANSYFSEINDSTVHYEFGNLSEEERITKIKNIRRIIEKGINNNAIKKYIISNGNKIEMQRYNSDKEEWQLSFDGEILLNGDAIKGGFYYDGKQVVPLRVYYNIDKPLPDPLIPEEEEEIDSNL